MEIEKRICEIESRSIHRREKVRNPAKDYLDDTAQSANDAYAKELIDKMRSDARIEWVRFLIDAGANLNYTDENGETALSSAIMQRRLDIVELLLDSGADVNLTAAGWSGKCTPLCFALQESESSELCEAPQDVERMAPIIALLRNRGGKE